MKTFRKNTFGFAHHALLGVLVIAITSYVGVRVLTASHALVNPPPGPIGPVGPSTFSPAEDHAFANSESPVTLDVAVYKSDFPTKVVWYRNGHLIATTTTHTKAGNDYKEHFKYTWKIAGASAGSYHWTAKVYAPKGSHLAVNNRGEKYLDTLVIGNGTLSDSHFIVPDNNAVWKSCDSSKYLRVEVNVPKDNTDSWVKRIKGVQFINTSPNHHMSHLVTTPTYIHDGVEITFHPHIHIGYDFYPVGANCLDKGHYDWIARVIGTFESDGEHLAQEHSDDGIYHLNLTVE